MFLLPVVSFVWLRVLMLAGYGCDVAAGIVSDYFVVCLFRCVFGLLWGVWLLVVL